MLAFIKKPKTFTVLHMKLNVLNWTQLAQRLVKINYIVTVKLFMFILC